MHMHVGWVRKAQALTWCQRMLGKAKLQILLLMVGARGRVWADRAATSGQAARYIRLGFVINCRNKAVDSA